MLSVDVCLKIDAPETFMISGASIYLFIGFTVLIIYYATTTLSQCGYSTTAVDFTCIS